MQRSKSNGGIGGNDGNGSGGGGSDDDPKLYPQRWIQLGYLSGLALISDWVCFSVAATPGTWDALYHRNASTLVDIFLFTNVAACFVEPAVVNKFGLRKVVVMAAAVMTVGCALRSGVVPATFFPGAVMPDYATEVAGTVLVGAAQPFFQCTPSQLSATWFGKSERALATAVAINANQIGIATSFLVGGIMAQSEAGLNSYFSLITVCSATLTLMIMGGSIVLGTYVDRTRKYKGVTIALFIASSLLLIPLGIGEGLDNRIVLASLLAMGAAVGPIQPINAELAVEVTYPADENTIVAVQQVCGNLFSALLVPLLEAAGAGEVNTEVVPSEGLHLQGDYVILEVIALIALLYFSTLEEDLKVEPKVPTRAKVDDMKKAPEASS
eukprot:gene2176-2884_t